MIQRLPRGHDLHAEPERNKFAAATITIHQTVKVLKHIILLAQENRSLDHYFGALLT